MIAVLPATMVFRTANPATVTQQLPWAEPVTTAQGSASAATATEVVNAWSAKWAFTTTHLANCVPVTRRALWMMFATTRLASACASRNTEAHVVTSVHQDTMASPTAFLVNVTLRAPLVKSVMPLENALAWLVSLDFSVTNAHLDIFLTPNATRASVTPTVLSVSPVAMTAYASASPTLMETNATAARRVSTTTHSVKAATATLLVFCLHLVGVAA